MEESWNRGTGVESHSPTSPERGGVAGVAATCPASMDLFSVQVQTIAKRACHALKAEAREVE